jgi:hypothetical protein
MTQPHEGTASKRVEDVDRSNWTPQERATLLFVIRDNQMLLIAKKRGLGAGKVNGPVGASPAATHPCKGRYAKSRRSSTLRQPGCGRVASMHFSLRMVSPCSSISLRQQTAKANHRKPTSDYEPVKTRANGFAGYRCGGLSKVGDTNPFGRTSGYRCRTPRCAADACFASAVHARLKSGCEAARQKQRGLLPWNWPHAADEPPTA